MSRNLAVLAAICLATCTTTNSARAEFIIDSFNAGESLTLPGGLTTTRTVGFVGAPGATFTENGTDITGTTPLFGGVELAYSFSAPLSATGDTLNGTPGLRLDFLEATGTYSVLASYDGGVNFANVGGFATTASPFSVAFAAPALLSTTDLVLQFFTSTGAGSFTLDRLTATPEPSTFAMVGLALVGGGVVYRRRKAQAALAA